MAKAYRHFDRTSLIWDSTLPTSEKFVLLAINSFASADGNGIFPKQQSLAEMTSMSRRTVNRVIGNLEGKYRILTQIHNYKDAAHGGGRRNSTYIVHWEVLETLAQSKCENLAYGIGQNDVSHAPKDHNITVQSKESNLTVHKYRTAFFSKTAECGEALLNSDQDKPEDNCPTPPPNGQIPRRPGKPKKLFDGSSRLSVDHNGWVALPKAIDVAPRYRELIGPVMAQAMVWTKVWFVGHYSDELELTLHYQDDGIIYAISGKDFDVMAYSEFLSKDGPVPVRMMRDVVMDRTGGFQEEFNDVLSYYFWEAFRRALQRSA